MKGFILYIIYYDDMLMYLGRTKQDLQQRIRGHFFSKFMHRKIDIYHTTKIEYSECKTEADLYLYEVYYINKYHPPLNVDDRANDYLTVQLPELEWKVFECSLIEKWKLKLSEDENKKVYKRNCRTIKRTSKRLAESNQTE